MESLRRPWVTIGVDIGQKHDPTAVCVAEAETRTDRDHFLIRHLERLPLGTPYPDVADGFSEAGGVDVETTEDGALLADTFDDLGESMGDLWVGGAGGEAFEVSDEVVGGAALFSGVDLGYANARRLSSLSDIDTDDNDVLLDHCILLGWLTARPSAVARSSWVPDRKAPNRACPFLLIRSS